MTTDEEYYMDWYSDNEDRLKEEFLMQYTQRELLEHILSFDGASESFFDVHYESFETFLSEQFIIYKEEVAYER